MKILTSKMSDLKLAAKSLKCGQLVAFPTETVYGVGAIYYDKKAYQKLNKLKKRKPDQPYTLMLADLASISKYAKVNQKILSFLKKFMPGSLTVLLPAKKTLPNWCKKNNIVGVRIPKNKEALSLLRLVGEPLLVPSLNRSGKTPLTNIKDIEKEFIGELSIVIAGEIKDNVPSTVISLVDGIKIIREGKISPKTLVKEYQKL